MSDILFINRWISQCENPSIMINSTCAILLDFFPQMFELENLRSTYIINCVFNVFLSCTTVMMNIATIYAFSLPQTLKTLLLSLAVSDVSVGLLGQPLYILTLIKWLQQNPPSCYIYRLLGKYFVRWSFLPRSGSCKCRQVLSSSSSSEIIGTCDSQACCCGGDISLDSKGVLLFSGVFGICFYPRRNILRRWVYWSLYNNSNLYPDLCNCATVQQSDSSPPSATADWRGNELC